VSILVIFPTSSNTFSKPPISIPFTIYFDVRLHIVEEILSFGLLSVINFTPIPALIPALIKIIPDTNIRIVSGLVSDIG